MLPISIKHRDGVIYHFYNKSCLKKPKGKRLAFSKINQSLVSSFANKFKASEILRINKLVKKCTNTRRDTVKKRIIRALSHGDMYVVSQDTASPVSRGEMQALRQEIKLLLNNLISIEQQESQKIEEEHKRRSGLEKAGEYVYETAAGLGSSVVSFLTWVKDVAELVSPTMQLIRQLEAAKVASGADPKNWFVTYNSHLKASNHKELIDVLGFDYTKINQQQTNELFETAHFVWEDEETQIIITNFVKQYAAAQHSLEWANFAGSAAFDVILTALLAFFTGGAGAVASAGAKVGKLAGPLKKLGEKFVELGKLLKKVEKPRVKSGVPIAISPSKGTSARSRDDQKGQKGQNDRADRDDRDDIKSNEPIKTNPKNIRAASKTWPPDKKERFDTADKYYDEAGYEDYDSHLRAIDYDKPVEIVEISEGEKLYQYSYPDRVTGEPKIGSYYYGNKSVDPNKLGFDIKGRKMIEVETENKGSFLQSSAADIEDWNGSGKIFEGGETQLFNPNMGSTNIKVIK